MATTPGPRRSGGLPNVEAAETHTINHGGRTVYVEESTMHLRHLIQMYQSRGAIEEEHDPSAIARFGRNFTAHWPFGYTQQA